MTKVCTICALMGGMVGGYFLFKKMNPECVENVKSTVSNMAKKASDKIENMM